MSLFTNETIERVRDSADFVEIVSAYTDLRRAGDRYTGLCPFHDERTPSFSVNAAEKLYYCFGCEAHGDLFTFISEKEGLAFPDAVETLADRYGIEIEREQEDRQAEESRRRRGRLGEALERAAAFYVEFLWQADEARKAREYLASRGLGEEVLREFGVGYAPSAWDTIVMRGQKAGFTVPELAGAGLVKKGRKDGFYDHFRARIMFPIRDARGRIQGFGGRTLSTEVPAKYVNSPEGELYRKKRTVYGIDSARKRIAKAGRAVVVEGYTDVLAAHQAEITETVAVMGTAITPQQVQLLAQHTEEIVLALDADRAGREAMLRAQRVASGKRVRLRVAAMPAGEDPADMLEAEGEGAAGRFRKILDEADELPVFHVRSLLEDADLGSPPGRDRALDEVVAVLAAMPDSITREELAREVADRLDADPALVNRRMSAAPKGGAAAPTRTSAAPASNDRPRTERGGAEAVGPRPLSSRERRERALLAMCIDSPAEGKKMLAKLSDGHLSGPTAVRARDWLKEHLDDPMGGIDREDEELLSLVQRLVVDADREPSNSAAMEINFLELEQGMVERQIEIAVSEGGDPPRDLQRQRADIVERIARQAGG